MVTRNQQIAIASLVVAFISLNWYVQTTEASIDYWIDASRERIYIQDENLISVKFKNGGDADGRFRLILKFTNATFSSETEMPYYIEADSSVSMSFILHKSESGEKVIYFTIDKNVSNFSIELTAEKNNITDFEKLNPIYPTKVIYKWSDKNECFELSN